MAESRGLQIRAELALVFLAVVWGSTFVMVKEALGDASTLLFLAMRFSLAFLVLLILFRGGDWEGRKWGKELRVGLLAGALLFAGYLCQTWGLLYTTAAKSGFLTGLNIVFVPLLAAAVYRRKPGVSEWLGVTAAAIGMGLLTLDGADAGVNRGDVLTVVCALAFALHLLVLNRYSGVVSYRNLSILQIGTAALLSLATFSWAEPVKLDLTPRLAIAVGVTSLLATALAFSLMTWAQRHTTATRSAILFSLEPAVALITSHLMTGEVLRTQAGWGAALILSGILLVELKPFRTS